MKVLVWKERRTDWLTLATTELTFRNIAGPYAAALALPSPEDEEALAELGAKRVQEMYGLEVSPEELPGYLEIAVNLCEGDYKEAIDYTIEQINLELMLP